MKIVELNTYNEYKNETMSYKYVIIYVSAIWCSPCDNIKSELIEIITEKQDDDVIFVKIDYDELQKDEELLEIVNTKHIPYFLIKNKFDYKKDLISGWLLQIRYFIDDQLEYLKNHIDIKTNEDF